MTGKIKFDGGEAAAEWFLVVDFDGSSEFHQVKSSQDSYVGEILPKVRPDVKFKSTAVKKKIDGRDTKTGFYRFWSVVGLGYSAAIKNLKNSYEQYENGELLQEGFFDAAKRIFNNFMRVIKNVFSKMRAFITASVKNMQDFLGLQPVINFNNNISW